MASSSTLMNPVTLTYQAVCGFFSPTADRIAAMLTMVSMPCF